MANAIVFGEKRDRLRSLRVGPVRCDNRVVVEPPKNSPERAFVVLEELGQQERVVLDGRVLCQQARGTPGRRSRGGRLTDGSRLCEHRDGNRGSRHGRLEQLVEVREDGGGGGSPGPEIRAPGAKGENEVARVGFGSRDAAGPEARNCG